MISAPCSKERTRKDDWRALGEEKRRIIGSESLNSWLGFESGAVGCERSIDLRSLSRRGVDGTVVTVTVTVQKEYLK